MFGKYLEIKLQNVSKVVEKILANLNAPRERNLLFKLFHLNSKFHLILMDEYFSLV